MVPVNNVFLGGSDPLLGMTSTDFSDRIAILDDYKRRLNELQQMRTQINQIQTQPVEKSLWAEIDSEVYPLSEEQRVKLSQNEEYAQNDLAIQQMVQSEILSLVKGKIESSPEGKELLSNQLKIVKKLKGKIVDESNREMEMFRKFKEFSKQNPEVTYEQFIKENI